MASRTKVRHAVRVKSAESAKPPKARKIAGVSVHDNLKWSSDSHASCEALTMQTRAHHVQRQEHRVSLQGMGRMPQ